MKTAYSYDSRNRIVGIQHLDSSGAILQSFDYTLDSIGNRIKEAQDNNRTVEYSYDSANRLISEKVSNDANGRNTTTTFGYDDVGNMLTKTIDGNETSYSYNDNDQLTQKDSTTFTCDANGNLITHDNITYSYDDKNRLIKAQTPNDTVEFEYDANDNRIAKIINGETTTYLIDTNTPYAQVITESKSDGTTIEYIYGNDLLSQSGDVSTLYYLSDALGSTRALADSTGNITDNYTYSPYGALIEHLGTSSNNFMFTGEQLDSETQDYYLRARYYSPSSSRFLSRDSYDGTVDSPLSQNHYLYTHGNPVMFIDPSGKSIYAQTIAIGNMIVRFGLGAYNSSKSARRAWNNFYDAYKTFCKLGKKQLRDIYELHHAWPVAFGNSRINGRVMAIFDVFHKQFHQLLHYALRFKGHNGLNNKTFQSFSSESNLKEVFNILMESASYYDEVCRPVNGGESMRDEIWRSLYGR